MNQEDALVGFFLAVIEHMTKSNLERVSLPYRLQPIRKAGTQGKNLEEGTEAKGTEEHAHCQTPHDLLRCLG